MSNRDQSCASCAHWDGSTDSYLGDCRNPFFYNMRTAFNDTCGEFTSDEYRCTSCGSINVTKVRATKTCNDCFKMW